MTNVKLLRRNTVNKPLLLLSLLLLLLLVNSYSFVVLANHIRHMKPSKSLQEHQQDTFDCLTKSSSNLFWLFHKNSVNCLLLLKHY